MATSIDGRAGQLDGEQPLGEAGGMLARRWRPSGASAASAALAVAALAGQRGQAQQHERGHGAAGRQGVVLQAARSCHERLGVVGRVVEAAVVGAEVRQDEVRQLARSDEEALLEGGLVERQQAVGEVGVVLERRRRAGRGRPSRSAAADRPGVRSSRRTKSAASVAISTKGGSSRARPASAKAPRPGRSRRPAPCRRGPAGAVRRGAAAARTRACVSASWISSRGRSNSTASEVSSRTRCRIVRPSQLPASVTP